MAKREEEEKHKSKELLELEHSLAEQHKLYLKDSENVISDTNLRQEEWITNSPLSSEKFSNDIFESLCKNTNKKLVFELLKNPYFPQEYLSELADVQESYSNDELYLLWLILKHPNCPETVLKEVSELDDSLDYKISLLKKAIALNPNAKKSIVQGLLKNVYRWVRQAAASHPSVEQKDILELIKIAELGVTELQKEDEEGDRYILKGLLENKHIGENLKQTISNHLEDEGKYPKQYTTYKNSQFIGHGMFGAGSIPTQVIVQILMSGHCGNISNIFSDNNFLSANNDVKIEGFFDDFSGWGNPILTNFYSQFGFFDEGTLNYPNSAGSGISHFYVDDSSIPIEEEEVTIDGCFSGHDDSTRHGLFQDFFAEKLEIGTFFFDIISYDDGTCDRYGEDGEFIEELELIDNDAITISHDQESELNPWDCIDYYHNGMFTGNKFFDSPDIEIRESDYDGNGTLYVKDSKNGFTEVYLDVLYDEVHKKFGDELNEENVIKYLKNKYKK